MVPLLSLARREAGARAFAPTRAGLNRGVLQARASGVLRGRKVKRSLRNPHYGNGVDFHYVSGAPSQLYRVLDEFLIEETGFPEGTFHMKNVPKNLAEPETWRAWRNLVSGDFTVEHKKAEISALIKACPDRRFILIGDSGEMDPEIFAAIRDEFPDQIEEILIRDVRGDALEPGSSRLHNMTVIPP